MNTQTHTLVLYSTAQQIYMTEQPQAGSSGQLVIDYTTACGRHVL